MPEWSIGPHSKCGERATVPRVRIPLFPPFMRMQSRRHLSRLFLFCDYGRVQAPTIITKQISLRLCSASHSTKVIAHFKWRVAEQKNIYFQRCSASASPFESLSFRKKIRIRKRHLLFSRCFLYIIATNEFIRLVAILCKRTPQRSCFLICIFFCRCPAASAGERVAVRATSEYSTANPSCYTTSDRLVQDLLDRFLNLVYGLQLEHR